MRGRVTGGLHMFVQSAPSSSSLSRGSDVSQIIEGRLTAGPLTVALYGEISPRAPQSIYLETPSPSRILPFKPPGQDVIPFSPVTFRCRGDNPRRKYRRTAMDEAWRSAVDLAHEADASLNDGLPSNLSSYKVGTVRIYEDKAEGSISQAKGSTNGQTKSPGLIFITL